MQQHGIWCLLASTEGGRWAGVLSSAPGRPSRRPPGRGSLWAGHCSLVREAPIINPQNLFFAQMNNNEIKEACSTGSKLGNNPRWVIPETESRLNSSAASDRKEKNCANFLGRKEWLKASQQRTSQTLVNFPHCGGWHRSWAVRDETGKIWRGREASGFLLGLQKV